MYIAIKATDHDGEDVCLLMISAMGRRIATGINDMRISLTI